MWSHFFSFAKKLCPFVQVSLTGHLLGSPANFGSPLYSNRLCGLSVTTLCTFVLAEQEPLGLDTVTSEVEPHWVWTGWLDIAGPRL